MINEKARYIPIVKTYVNEGVGKRNLMWGYKWYFNG